MCALRKLQVCLFLHFLSTAGEMMGFGTESSSVACAGLELDLLGAGILGMCLCAALILTALTSLPSSPGARLVSGPLCSQG